MKALLTQIAVLLGGLVAVLSLAVNLAQGMELLTAVYRGSLVFFGTVIILFVFLRFFSMILVGFVAEQVMQNRPQDDTADGAPAPAVGNAPPAGAVSVPAVANRTPPPPRR